VTTIVSVLAILGWMDTARLVRGLLFETPIDPTRRRWQNFRESAELLLALMACPYFGRHLEREDDDAFNFTGFGVHRLVDEIE